MKRLLSIILTATILLSALCFTPTVGAKTKEYTSGNCVYTVDKNGNATVVDFCFGKSDSSDYWKIPTKLDGHKVTRISTKWSVNNHFRKIRIPKTVKSINNNFSKTIHSDYKKIGFLATVICDKNSYTHKYAVKNNLVYKLVGDKKTYGDIDILCFGLDDNNKLSGYGLKAYNSVGKQLKRDGELYVNCSYDGKKNPPAVTMKNKGTILKKNKDYTLTYSHNYLVGTGFVFVKGKGNYSGTIAFSFYIKPPKQHISELVKVSDTQIKMNYGVPFTYAEIQYSEVADFSTKTIIKGERTNLCTIINLEKGKKYYIRIRNYAYMPTYRIYGVVDEHNYSIEFSGNKFLYGQWSEVKPITL